MANKQTKAPAAERPKRQTKPKATAAPEPVNPFKDITSQAEAQALIERKGRWTNDENIQQDCVISGIDWSEKLIAVEICVHRHKAWSDPFRVEPDDFTRIVLM